jgi:hypothetical protein
MRHMKRWSVAVLAVLVVGAMCAPADASLMLRLGSTIVLDDGPGDSSPGLGVVTFNGVLGNFAINVTTAISKPVLPGAQIDLNSVNVVSSGSGDLEIVAGDVDYAMSGTPLLITGAVGGTIKGAAGSYATIQSWVDPTNWQPNPNVVVPAGSVPVWDPAVTTFTDPANPLKAVVIDSSASKYFDSLGTFALYAQVNLHFTGPGAVSFNEDQTVVPEPATIIVWSLLGGLAIAFGWRRCR